MHAVHADGLRVLTTTKNLRRGARTAMLLLPDLLRVDVIAHDDSYAIRLRKLCTQRLVGGLATLTRHEEGDRQISAFHVEPSDGDVRRVEISVALPSHSTGDEVPCTAVAYVHRR